MGQCHSCHSGTECKSCHSSDPHSNDLVAVETVALWIAPKTFPVGEGILNVTEARIADFPSKHMFHLDDFHISNVALTCELSITVTYDEEENRKEACFSVNNMCGPRPGRVNKKVKLIKPKLRLIFNVMRRHGPVTVDVDDLTILGDVPMAKLISQEKLKSDFTSIMEDHISDKIDEHRTGRELKIELVPVLGEQEGISAAPKINHGGISSFKSSPGNSAQNPNPVFAALSSSAPNNDGRKKILV